MPEQMVTYTSTELLTAVASRLLEDKKSVMVGDGQSVQVGNEKVAIVLVRLLQLYPVGQCAHIVAQMELTGGPHAT